MNQISGVYNCTKVIRLILLFCSYALGHNLNVTYLKKKMSGSVTNALSYYDD